MAKGQPTIALSPDQGVNQMGDRNTAEFRATAGTIQAFGRTPLFICSSEGDLWPVSLSAACDTESAQPGHWDHRRP